MGVQHDGRGLELRNTQIAVQYSVRHGAYPAENKNKKKLSSYDTVKALDPVEKQSGIVW